MDWLPFPGASPLASGSVSAGDVIVPLLIFLLGATGAGIAGLVKFAGCMAGKLPRS